MDRTSLKGCARDTRLHSGQSETYADAVYARILARPDQLQRFPDSGSIVPEYCRSDIREIFVHSFRIIYRIDGDEVRVLTVIHGSRQLPPEIPDGG